MVLCDALCDVDTLPLSAGEFGQLTTREVCDSQTLHRGRNFRAILRGWASKHSQSWVAAHGHSLGHGDGSSCRHRCVLQHVADVVANSVDGLTENGQ